MSFLTLLACSLLVTSAYSQLFFGGGGGGYGGRPGGHSFPVGPNNGGSNGRNNGGNNGRNNGGNFNNGRCTCNLNCVTERANGNAASCQPEYTAVSCSCGMGCGSYNIQGTGTCSCQCLNVGWTTARCCKIDQ